LLRRRRQKQAEEDYRRNAANIDNFVSGGKLHTSASSMNDSRIDPSFMDRRQSNGSIADNEDYSRRILKVGAIVWLVASICTNTSPGHQRLSISMTALVPTQNFLLLCPLGLAKFTTRYSPPCTPLCDQPLFPLTPSSPALPRANHA
jgi:hypothetical protein